MFPDHALELWPAPAEQEPSRGCSGPALRKDAAAPPRPLFAGAELGAVSERASPGDLPGGVLAGRSWGGVTHGSGQGGAAGHPSRGRSQRPCPAERSAGSHASPCRRAGCRLRGTYAAPKPGGSALPFLPSTRRRVQSPASPGDRKGPSRGALGHAGASSSCKVRLRFPQPSRRPGDAGSLSHAGAVTLTLPEQRGRRRVPRAALLPGVSPVPATHGGGSGPCAPRFHPHIPT